MLNFRWDAGKAALNRRRHGVSFFEAFTAFEDALSITIPDPEHSRVEERFRLIGQTLSGRLVVVAFTEWPDHIRIISARLATRRERQAYEEDS